MVILKKKKAAFLIAYIRVFSLLFALLLLLWMFVSPSSPLFTAATVGGVGAFFFCAFYLHARMERYRCIFHRETIEIKSGLFNIRRSVLIRNRITYVTWMTTPLQVLFHLGIAVVTYPGAVFLLDSISKEDFNRAFGDSSPERRGDG